ncbi:MAG: hypothetical protein ACR2PX_21975 [Endozoicomonas sp.]|uniref:hypothetical protein n=1 Tax=Endozoicomonas sp. TaxID=1892382 RepID=UPI003D9B386B
MTELAAMPQYEAYKDSGGEWLGGIPEHWSVMRLKNLADINPAPKIPYEKYDELACFLPMENVEASGQVNYELKKPIRDLKQGFTSFQQHDVIIAKITPCFENGKGAYLGGMPTKQGFGSTEFHVLRANRHSNPKFLYYLSKTDLFMSLGERLMTGSAGQKRVPTDFLANFFRLLADSGELETG